MAMHMVRKSGLNFLRFALLRQQVTRHASALASRGIFAAQTINNQSFSANASVILPGFFRVRCLSDAPTLTAAELEARTLEVIKCFDKVDPEKVTVNAHFINDMGLDSLDVVDILMAFEDEFGVEISDEQAEKIFTPKEAIEFMKTFLDIHDH